MSTDAAADSYDFTLTGHAGELVGTAWPIADPGWIAIITHGYGEHVLRYRWVAEQLNAAGATVYAADHRGHGRSAGERVEITDFEPVVADVAEVLELATHENPELPVVLIGHSMGGMIAARFAQLHGEDLAALVLSGPVLGRWEAVEELLVLEEIPPTPIDVATLSRDPDVGRAYAADPLIWHGDFKRVTLLALHDELELINTGGGFEDLPVLYLHGEADELVPIGPSAEAVERLRGERTETKSYPEARHEIFNELNRDEVLDDVIGFVASVLGDRVVRR
ncbi:lysophospholipase [Enemella evansiae]|uniref:Lysophospholipase n=1 Tax=Enemella evansiae TaxID=2016499 RepID=A0A255GAX2_9ACTN|nr:alpha/beta hydrolase [Enemella evansiae]OYN98567.1 lysophospholipase [Enemella evansiae]OYO11546.1 lysophospholipase [Enemella evansiae]